MDEAPTGGPASRCTVEDELFGSLTATLTGDGDGDALARVEGPGLPTAMIVRAGMARDHAQAPVGTRDTGRLTMTVGGDAAGLRLGPGRLTRSSFGVRAELPGRAYSFEPVSSHSSVLRRDGRQVATFVSGEDELSAVWRPEESCPAPQDAAVGYVLATAFGTGAASTGSLVVEAVLQMFGAGGP